MKLNEMSFNNKDLNNTTQVVTANSSGPCTGEGKRHSNGRINRRDMTELIYIEACNIPNSIEGIKT